MLEKRRLGGTGLEVSLLGFGGIPIMRIPRDEATAVIREALAQGIDFFDTARGYGDSEKKIGEALRSAGARPILASKSPKRDKAGMLEDVGASLAALGVEAIDLYQLHCVSTREDFDQVTGHGGAYEALADARREGRVGHIGITSHNLEIARLAVECGKFETIQVLFNVIEDGALSDVLPLARDRNVGVIAMKPFGGGYIEECEIALRWVLSEPTVIAIPGVATAAQVRQNVSVARSPRPLAAADLALIAAIRANLGGRYCRRCDYCQPCPNEIPISLLLQVEGIRKRVGESAMRTDSWRGVLSKADACDQCGTCEPRCPFALPVMGLLKQARESLGRILE
jgi:hypothetical protein